MRVLGLDPGLRVTGWGIVESEGAHLRHVANGRVATDDARSLADRLVQLHDGLAAVIAQYAPEVAAVEETFVNKNPSSTLKLGVARGVVLLVPARAGLLVAEYAANAVKKSVVGVGHAAKEQVQMMVQRLLPGVALAGADAADALAVAICHVHHAATAHAWSVRVAASAAQIGAAR
ncbi:MAG TPA: crossover junction endodeoxyribonuclease RuvC [Alphaproteobacteria bacterium]